MVSPPKYLSSTTCALRASNVASRSSASSSAMQVGGALLGPAHDILEGHALRPGSPPGGTALARPLDEDATHRLRGNREEVDAVLGPDTRVVDEAQVRLVHERRRVERVARPLAAHVAASQAPELGVEQRNEAIERAAVTVAPVEEQAGDVPRAWVRHGHGRHANLFGKRREYSTGVVTVMPDA